ncbi:ribonuclease H-like domain-containing protein [Phytophthora cinnamomi]|uniref:ribonuclease H-like domain-containing protein n=1 Tax=Phytophthora cinnamomi TaxID=4785 RepID=UPI003559B511|nr:ribonuclease H-like domain-containing protein [Phytophthora cinnamomi]
MPKGKGGYYAVASGREPGVYKSWDSAKAQTNGYSHNQHQRFETHAEANAYMAGYSGGTGKAGNPPVRE